MYINQREMMYFPSGEIRSVSIDQKEVYQTLRVEDEQGLSLKTVYAPAATPDELTIVYFHGNKGNFSTRLDKADIIRDSRRGILFAEYTGYGGNSGKPTEPGLFHDSRTYLNWLIDEQGISPKNIVLYGESLGSGAAIQMASEYKVAGVVLDGAYDSTASVAKEGYFYVPISILMQDQFKSIDKIKQVKEPVLFLHGTEDKTVDISHAERLYEATAGPKKFVKIENAGHNDLYDHGAALHVQKFFSKLDSRRNK